MNSVLLPDPASAETMTPDSALAEQQVPTDVTKKLIGGTSALGASVFIERGSGFLANILAARLGGAPIFGAYSLAISQVNNISTYAAGGIGSTAARFSGKYPYGTPGYKSLGRALAIVSLVSAAMASIGLWAGAGPIAHLLHKESLTGLLRWSALSAAGIILLECARGFFVGQRRHAALMLLSSIVGVGLIAFIPLAASRHNPVHMIVSQGIITTTAVVICLLLSRSLGLRDLQTLHPKPLGPILREVWSYGFIQLAGLIASNLAGWWMITVVARADTSLIQMSFFSIASQLRNMVALPPALLTESSYAVMADREGDNSNTPSHVMALCTYASSFSSLVLASLGIILVPWGLRIVYGHAYDAAAITTAFALAVAVAHMGNGPAAARLSIVSIRAAGIINTIWAVFVAAAASVFLIHRGSAGRAMGIYLAAHILSAILVLCMLAWKDHIPSGVLTVFFLSTSTSVGLAGLSVLRDRYPGSALSITGLMALVALAAWTALFFLGRKNRWLPDAAAVRRMWLSAKARLSGFRRSAAHRSGEDA
jgi:O-antigen/teichoic acid export membrane protein